MEKQTSVSVYENEKSFEHAQRIAKSLAQAELVPNEYKNNIPNTLIAIEIANRIGASPMMVMQNLNIINGKPSWSSTFIISAINNCGKFSPLQFEVSGSGATLTCYAHTKDLKSGNILKGPKVTMQMAKAEGWLDKKGSKWLTMPELMIMYRSATFFGRLYCPEILMGMQSVDEVIDITHQEIKPIANDFDEEEESTPPVELPKPTINELKAQVKQLEGKPDPVLYPEMEEKLNS